MATAQFAAQKPEKKPYHNLLKIDLVWRNLSKGALYAGRTECLVVILRVVIFARCFPLLGESTLQCFATRSSFTQRSGALACYFGQQNDNRQADQPEQNPNCDPTHGFGSLSVMGRFRRMRRLCNLHHCSVLSQKEACTWHHYFHFTPAIQRQNLGTEYRRRIGAHL